MNQKTAFTKKEYLLYILFLIGALSVGLFYILKNNAAFVSWFLEDVTPGLRLALGAIASVLPFSLAELFYVALILFAVPFFIRLVYLVLRGRLGRRGTADRLLVLLTIAVFLWSGFSWLWNISYSGKTFEEQSGINTKDLTVAQLYDTCIYFAEQAADLSDQVARDDNGHFAADRRTYFDDSLYIYDNVEEDFPFLQRKALRPKPFLNSWALSLMSFTGFYFPMTGEANINIESPAVFQPVTIAHEMAHQRQVTPEQEANFVGILASVTSGNTTYEYSGYLFGLLHLSNALYRADYDKWLALRELYTPEMITDLSDNNAFWAKKETVIETVSDKVYEAFLHGNGQTLGLQSYGACVYLLVAYF